MATKYSKGQAVAEDSKKAVEWYLRAANANNNRAQFNLGCAYEHGRMGLPKDPQQAIHWYSQAAAQGHSYAKVNLTNLSKF